jgi:hypothetical protein
MRVSNLPSGKGRRGLRQSGNHPGHQGNHAKRRSNVPESTLNLLLRVPVHAAPPSSLAVLAGDRIRGWDRELPPFDEAAVPIARSDGRSLICATRNASKR